MSMHDLYPYIFTRKSTRKYNDQILSSSIMDQIQEKANSMKPLNPEINTEFQIVPSQDINSRMMKKAPHYLLFFSEVQDDYLINAGYMLQQMDLYLNHLNLGCCWQGIPQPKKRIIQNVEKEYVILLAMGSSPESVKRENVSQFKRKNLQEISNISGADELLEPVRLAPSSINSQPWYLSGDPDLIHIYQKKPNILKSFFTKKFNQIDMGIALLHLDLAAQHQDKKIQFIKTSEASDLDKYNYIATARME